jgi:hypothetical protein
MTPQEQQLLNGLIQRVQQTQLAEKDTEAEQVLSQSLGKDPDALYILCQTVLVQQYALEQAKKQLEDTRQQLEALKQQPPPQPAPHTSFLGSIFGSSQPAPPPPYAPANYGPPQPGYGQPGYGQPYPPPQYAPSGGFGGGGFGGGGFLQGAMQTAAGVAAGELAFRGIEDLMHGFGREAGYGSDREMGGFGGQPEIINNYYNDDRGDRGGGFGDRLQAADGSPSLSPDLEDRRDSFAGADDGPSQDLDDADPSDSNTDDFADTDDSSDSNDGSDDGGGDFSSTDDSSF